MNLERMKELVSASSPSPWQTRFIFRAFEAACLTVLILNGVVEPWYRLRWIKSEILRLKKELEDSK